MPTEPTYDRHVHELLIRSSFDRILESWFVFGRRCGRSRLCVSACVRLAKRTLIFFVGSLSDVPKESP